MKKRRKFTKEQRQLLIGTMLDTEEGRNDLAALFVASWKMPPAKLKKFCSSWDLRMYKKYLGRLK